MAEGFEAKATIFGPGSTGGMEYAEALYLRESETAPLLEIPLSDTAITASEAVIVAIEILPVHILEATTVSEGGFAVIYEGEPPLLIYEARETVAVTEYVKVELEVSVSVSDLITVTDAPNAASEYNIGGSVYVGPTRGASSVSYGAENLTSFRHLFDASGFVTSLWIEPGATSGTDIRVGLYSDEDVDQADALLTEAERTATLLSGWAEIVVPPCRVEAGEYYWFAFLPSAAITVRYLGSSSRWTVAGFGYGPLPDPYGSMGTEYTTYRFNARATVQTMADLVVVSEFVNVMVLEEGTLTPILSESVVVSEAATVQLADLAIAVSDVVGVSESANCLQPREVAVSDVVAVSDSPYLTLSDIKILTSDVVDASDYRTVLLENFCINRSQTITVSESVGALVHDFVCVYVMEWVRVEIETATTLTINRTDSVTVSESIGISISVPSVLNISVSDVVAVAEAVSPWTDRYYITTYDIITTQDVPNAWSLVDYSISVSDSITCSEAVSVGPLGLQLYVKVSGSWVPATAWVRVGGNWLPASVKGKASGEWKGA